LQERLSNRRAFVFSDGPRLESLLVRQLSRIFFRKSIGLPRKNSGTSRF
jgi:hypothetical protein